MSFTELNKPLTNEEKHTAATKEPVYVRTLTLHDLEACVDLEQKRFPPAERCSRENFIYRFTAAPELSLGLFTTHAHSPPSPPRGVPTPSTAPHTEVLLGHAIATKTTSPTATDACISKGGHMETGATIALHSLVITPEHQGKQLGTTLLKSFIQRMGDAGCASRVALIARGPLTKFYEKFGFVDSGPSDVVLGGGGWTDMILEFQNSES